MKKKLCLYILLVLFVIVFFCYVFFIYSKKSEDGIVPSVFLTTTEEINDEYISSNLRMQNGDKIIDYTNVAIKLHGNSTKLTDKHPYTIKFNNKKELFNIGNSKTWILLANYYDETLLRNKIVFDFSLNSKLHYTSKTMFIDLYLNTEYIGNYLLVEKIDIDDDKIDIDINQGDYLLELETLREMENEFYVVTNKYNWRFNVKDVDTFDINQQNKILSSFDKIESALESKNYQSIKEYIDIDSFVDQYIIEEYFKDVDCNFSSLYFYFKNGKLYAGPIWDFDLSMGNSFDNEYHDEYNNRNGKGNNSNHSYEGIYCAKNIYGELLQIKEFKKLVIKRYKQLQPNIKELYESSNNSLIDKYYNKYQTTIEKNICKWNIDDCNNYDNYQIKINELKNWLKNRNDWLLKEFI